LLDRYLDLLLDANTRINLTGLKDRAAAELNHVGDALTALSFIPSHARRLADVGSGGGCPGIPLAIARPDLHVTLIEATQKKAAFLASCVKELQLPNVGVLPSRAEDAANGRDRQRFDVAIARAVAPMVFLAEWCLPLVKVGGKFLAMKGERIAEELPAAQKAIRLTGGAKATVHPIQLPNAEHHVIVELPKIAVSDSRYPRPPSQAKGKPLA
jgi:16S rRNA (guanine527-N7)-methyltransferase